MVLVGVNSFNYNHQAFASHSCPTRKLSFVPYLSLQYSSVWPMRPVKALWWHLKRRIWHFSMQPVMRVKDITRLLGDRKHTPGLQASCRDLVDPSVFEWTRYTQGVYIRPTLSFCVPWSNAIWIPRRRSWNLQFSIPRLLWKLILDPEQMPCRTLLLRTLMPI